MWKNYGLAALNVAVAGLPILAGWDVSLYLIYWGLALLLLAMVVWNPVGELCVVWFVFHARRVPDEALIMPALRRYLRDATSKGDYLKQKCRFYYAESRIPYFIPISRERVVLSLALEDYLIQDHTGALYRDVPKEAYIPKMVFSRRLILLSILCYVLILRFIEVWTIVAVALVRFIGAVVMMIVTGAFFEGLGKMLEAICVGVALGTIAWKINEWFSFIQDKIVEFLMERTMKGTFDYLKKSGMPKGQGIRLERQ